jgi:hypothetical protein
MQFAAMRQSTRADEVDTFFAGTPRRSGTIRR